MPAAKHSRNIAWGSATRYYLSPTNFIEFIPDSPLSYLHIYICSWSMRNYLFIIQKFVVEMNQSALVMHISRKTDINHYRNIYIERQNRLHRSSTPRHQRQSVRLDPQVEPKIILLSSYTKGRERWHIPQMHNNNNSWMLTYIVVTNKQTILLLHKIASARHFRWRRCTLNGRAYHPHRTSLAVASRLQFITTEAAAADSKQVHIESKRLTKQQLQKYVNQTGSM